MTLLNNRHLLAFGAVCLLLVSDQAAAQNQPTPTLQQTLNYISGAIKAAVIFNKNGRRFEATDVYPNGCDVMRIHIEPLTSNDRYFILARFRIIDVIQDPSGDDFTVLQCAQTGCFERSTDQIFTFKSPSNQLGKSFRNALNHLQSICGKKKSLF